MPDRPISWLSESDNHVQASWLTLHPRRLWKLRPFRFLLVGAANTLFGYLLYLIGLWIGLPYQAALAVATVLGAIFNFFTTGRIVFENRALRKIFAFLAIYAVIYIANLALLTWAVHAGIAKTLAQGLVLPFVVVLSYILNKYLVFGRFS